MKRSPQIACVSMLAALIWLSAGPGLSQKNTANAYRPAKSAHANAPQRALKIDAPPGAPVIVVSVDKTIELGIAAFIRRAVDEHPDAAAILLDVNTLGGRVDAAIQIRDALLNAKPKVIGFIHPRAISAGALITLASDLIFVSDGASIGAATPYAQGQGQQGAAVEEKMVSYMRAEMRSTAEANGRRGDVAEAMVDRDVVIKGVIDAGKLLTLDTQRALELKIADAKAASIEEVLRQVSLSKAPVKRLEINWGEKIARILTEPTLSGLLLSIGMLGIMVAFYTRTVGIFTVLGFIALGLFFGGHATVHLVGWEEVLLLGVGLILLALEVFLIPGFGIAGAAGIVAICAALVLSLIGLPLDISFKVGALTEAVQQVAISMFVAMAMGVAFIRYFPRTPLGRKMILEDDLAASESAQQLSESLVGAVGTAFSDLRPEGKVSIDQTRYEARSEREYITRDEKVYVIAVDGAAARCSPRKGRDMSIVAIITLLALGLVLMLAEIFVVPGFGVAGMLGLIALGVGSYGAWSELGPLWGVVALGSSALVAILALYLFPKTRTAKRMILSDVQEGVSAGEGFDELLHARGITVTPLRPAGMAHFDTREVDVVTSGEYLEQGVRIIVVEVEGSRVVVQKLNSEA